MRTQSTEKSADYISVENNYGKWLLPVTKGVNDQGQSIYIYLKTQSKKVKTSADCFTSANHQEVSKLGFKVSLVVNN